jgi:hypothetical protein
MSQEDVAIATSAASVRSSDGSVAAPRPGRVAERADRHDDAESGVGPVLSPFARIVSTISRVRRRVWAGPLCGSITQQPHALPIDRWLAASPIAKRELRSRDHASRYRRGYYGPGPRDVYGSARLSEPPRHCVRSAGAIDRVSSSA